MLHAQFASGRGGAWEGWSERFWGQYENENAHIARLWNHRDRNAYPSSLDILLTLLQVTSELVVQYKSIPAWDYRASSEPLYGGLAGAHCPWAHGQGMVIALGKSESSHTTSAHWQYAEACNSGVSVTSSV